MAQDVPAVWHAPTTTQAERKQLVRCRIKDVTVTKRPTTIPVAMRWHTEACTVLEVPRPRRAAAARRTAPAMVERIRTLAPTLPDSQIAVTLNREGGHAGLGGAFTASKVAWIRYASHMPVCGPEAPGVCPTGQRGDGRSSARAAAALLHVDVSTIADWGRAGQLEYVQPPPHSPRWITLTPERLAALRKPVRQRQPRPRPRVSRGLRGAWPAPTRRQHLWGPGADYGVS